MIKNILAIVGVLVVLVFAEKQYNEFKDSEAYDKIEEVIEIVKDKFNE